MHDDTHRHQRHSRNHEFRRGKHRRGIGISQRRPQFGREIVPEIAKRRGKHIGYHEKRETEAIVAEKLAHLAPGHRRAPNARRLVFGTGRRQYGQTPYGYEQQGYEHQACGGRHPKHRNIYELYQQYANGFYGARGHDETGAQNRSEYLRDAAAFHIGEYQSPNHSQAQPIDEHGGHFENGRHDRKGNQREPRGADQTKDHLGSVGALHFRNDFDTDKLRCGVADKLRQNDGNLKVQGEMPTVDMVETRCRKRFAERIHRKIRGEACERCKNRKRQG